LRGRSLFPEMLILLGLGRGTRGSVVDAGFTRTYCAEIGAMFKIGVDSSGLTELICLDLGSADSKGVRVNLRGGIGANERRGWSGMECGGGGTVPTGRWRFTRKHSWEARTYQGGLVTHRYFVRTARRRGAHPLRETEPQRVGHPETLSLP
jgi:hypothetical protein